MLQLIFPNKTHKLIYEKLIKEWWEFETIPTPPNVLFHWKNFEEFLENVNNELWEMPWKVPAHLFFLIDDEIKDEIIWAIQVRHHINHPNLIEVGW
jgi:predicted acetyltransferase